MTYAAGALTHKAVMSTQGWWQSGLAVVLGSLVFAALGLFMGYLLPSENAMQFLVRSWRSCRSSGIFGPDRPESGYGHRRAHPDLRLQPDRALAAEPYRRGCPRRLPGELGGQPVAWGLIFVAGAIWRFRRDTARCDGVGAGGRRGRARAAPTVPLHVMTDTPVDDAGPVVRPAPAPHPAKAPHPAPGPGAGEPEPGSESEGTLARHVRTASRFALAFAGAYLLFLAPPSAAAWSARQTAAGVVGLLLTVGFCLVYLAIFAFLWSTWTSSGPAPLGRRAHRAARVARSRYGAHPRPIRPWSQRLRRAWQRSCSWGFGPRCSPAWRWSLSPKGWPGPCWAGRMHRASACRSSPAAGMFGVRSLTRRNVELMVAREENARPAVENERSRIARDPHDILGHSLTVITVKAELAGRLLEGAPQPSGSAARSLTSNGSPGTPWGRATHRRGLPRADPARRAGPARLALDAAGIKAVLPNSTDEVDSGLREVFAWAVREGVTNVVRHSAASECTVRLGRTSVSIPTTGEARRQRPSRSVGPPTAPGSPG